MATGGGADTPIKLEWEETCASTIGVESIKGVGSMVHGVVTTSDGVQTAANAKWLQIVKWELKQLANNTEQGFNAIKVELRTIRLMTLRNRYVLNLLTAMEKVPQASTGFFTFELVYDQNSRDVIEILKDVINNKSSPKKTRILDPSGDRYYWWLNIMVIPVTYNWVIIISRSCFYELQQNHLYIWLTLDYLCDLLYLMDTVAWFHTGYLEQGILVVDRQKIAKHYVKTSNFRWNILSLLPTDLLYLKMGIDVPVVRVNRFLRTPRLFEAFDRTETRIAYPNAFRICKLMAYVFVVIHWNSCIYFALSNYIGFGKDIWVYPNTTDPDFGRLARQYIYSFYFSTLILTTVGDTPHPQQEEEFLFMVADFLIAVLGFATIMGSMSSVISNMNSADAAFYPNHNLVKLYLQMHKVNKNLKNRVISWHQHLQINKKMTNENDILKNLPERLRAEVAISVHLPTLSKVQIFQNCEKSLLEELVLKLKPQVYSPGEYVCKKGDIGREMYIIKEGKLAVVADDGVTEYAVLGEGQYFGEISILNIKGNMSGNRRTANIKSIGYSDLFCLSKEDLKEVLTEYPDAKAILEEKGREILLKMKKLDENAAAMQAARQQELETKVLKLEANLEGLRTKLARLLAELESSARKMSYRIDHLEWETNLWPDPDDPGEGCSPTLQ
ncbi:cyclic nucleotide-gated channel alpha-4 [Ambystoma mexicanum]|uniref:cyclic nucleotide-gated channel alpha-4 n=1 Tax=Ambystoma mexicanum TaxID=8296 RepID=UPI0037E92198